MWMIWQYIRSCRMSLFGPIGMSINERPRHRPLLSRPWLAPSPQPSSVCCHARIFPPWTAVLIVAPHRVLPLRSFFPIVSKCIQECEFQPVNQCKDMSFHIKNKRRVALILFYLHLLNCREVFINKIFFSHQIIESGLCCT